MGWIGDWRPGAATLVSANKYLRDFVDGIGKTTQASPRVPTIDFADVSGHTRPMDSYLEMRIYKNRM